MEKKRLEEQLMRCREWLKEEPDDEEVIQKVKELEDEIQRLEKIDDENQREEERLESLNNIENLKKELMKIKREVNSRFPYIEGFEDEMMVLKEIDNSIKKVQVKVFYEKLDELNQMVKEYNEKYGEV